MATTQPQSDVFSKWILGIASAATLLMLGILLTVKDDTVALKANQESFKKDIDEIKDNIKSTDDWRLQAQRMIDNHEYRLQTIQAVNTGQKALLRIRSADTILTHE